MPTYVITGPDGKKYKIKGAGSREEALSAFKRKMGGAPQQPSVEQPISPQPAQPPQATWGETALDVGKSLGTGLAQGAIGTAGMVGDIPRLAGKGFGYAYDTLSGATPEQRSANQAQFEQSYDNSPMGYLTSDAITKGVESVTGPMYQPQTTAGQFANTLGQFAPAAISPGSALRKAASVAVPAFASEGAGQLTEGTAAEPYARLAGGLAGGVATLGGTKGAIKQMQKAAPSAAQVKSDAGSMFNQLRNAGITYDTQSFAPVAQNVDAMFAQGGWDAALNPHAEALKNRIVSLANGPIDFNDIHAVEKMAGNILRGGQKIEKADKAFAAKALEELDRWTSTNPVVSTNGSVAPAEVKALFGKAKEMGRRNILHDQIKEMDRKSDWYTSGGESGLRNAFASYGRSSAGKFLTDAEEEAFKKVVKREGVLNLTHMAGSRFSLPAMAVGGGAAVLGTANPIVGALLAAGGNYAARKGMEMYTQKAVKAAQKTVLAGKDAQKAATQATSKLKQDRLARALVTTVTARASVESKGRQPVLYTDGHGRQWAKDPKTGRFVEVQ